MSLTVVLPKRNASVALARAILCQALHDATGDDASGLGRKSMRSLNLVGHERVGAEDSSWGLWAEFLLVTSVLMVIR